MRCGTLAYATWQGLGILARAFHTHGLITDVCVIEHAHWPTHYDWYPGAPTTHIRRMSKSSNLIREFVRNLDVFLAFETPFDWSLFPFCKKVGVKTALVPMYECMPNPWPHQPDIIINPSLLDQQYYPRGVFIPVPIEVPWKLRERAKVFIHNAGHGGLKGRNGTRELIDSLQYLTTKPTVIIRDQNHSLDIENRLAEVSSKVDVHYSSGTFPYEKLYENGDVFVFPEKFNGLSLPLQEALASGMLVMASNRFPMNTWLPEAPLIPVRSYIKDRIGSFTEFDRAEIDPKDIAAKIDEFYDQDISEYSLFGKQWAEEHSWEKLKPRYLEILGVSS
jgi:hypothetical protein